MRRLVILLVAVCALLACGGAAVNDALVLSNAGATQVAASADNGATATCQADPDHSGAVHFQPCGRMRDGMAVPCHPVPGVLGCEDATVTAPPVAETRAASEVAEPDNSPDRLFRPPRAIALSRAA